MKKIMTFSIVLSVVALVYAFAGDTNEETWFDMKNCDMCVTMMETPEMMSNVTWEHYDIANGMMTVSTAKADFIESFRAVEKNMGEVGAKMMGGEEVKLCNACTSYGALMAKGATREKINTMQGSVCLMTSSDAEVVSMIHDWSAKTNAEMAKMAKMDKGAKGHEGHGH